MVEIRGANSNFSEVRRETNIPDSRQQMSTSPQRKRIPFIPSSSLTRLMNVGASPGQSQNSSAHCQPCEVVDGLSSPSPQDAESSLGIANDVTWIR
jgi:hypothetical protein